MATDANFIQTVLDQAGLADRLTARKMFGEYGFHLDGTFVALACDNSFFIKDTAAMGRHGLNLPKRAPYPGAKPTPVADELLDDPERLQLVLIATAAALPPPKRKHDHKDNHKNNHKKKRKKTRSKTPIPWQAES